ncbi:hypothetical protein BJF83_20805 [Nocardiopsis sp. CNR-923]|uniref:hypothetical protein n=1 Tax=Nocardiopsis sp. CNR-923 TaxID=1904965 RepID=UPI000960D088|nr:hypothetical protein [Nocardiopsis sp. CNR-923]OLT26528.1 hypothetical protein BJF83_20805 [Nocardiopsis sp. CNR-923]
MSDCRDSERRTHQAPPSRDNQLPADSGLLMAAPVPGRLVMPTVPRRVPDRVRVGHLHLQVLIDQGAIDAASEERDGPLSGYSDAEQQRIVLAPGAGPDFEAETLLHELLHMCLRVSGRDPNEDAKAEVDDIEESTVNSMSGPLLAILRDNPDLVAYLTATPPWAGGG